MYTKKMKPPKFNYLDGGLLKFDYNLFINNEKTSMVLRKNIFLNFDKNEW